MNNTNSNITQRNSYKIIGRYRFEIITVVCPHCFGMISRVEGIDDNECSICNRRISSEDMEVSNDIL